MSNWWNISDEFVVNLMLRGIFFECHVQAFEMIPIMNQSLHFYLEFVTTDNYYISNSRINKVLFSSSLRYSVIHFLKRIDEHLIFEFAWVSYLLSRI